MKVDGQEAQTGQDEILAVHRFVTQPAIIRYSHPIKLTKAYQSVGIEVGIELPCYVEEIDKGFERAAQLVAARLKAEMPKLQATLKKAEEITRG